MATATTIMAPPHQQTTAAPCLVSITTSVSHDHIITATSSFSSSSASPPSPPLPPPAHRALEQLEILLHIAPFLTDHDLSACSLVSMDFYQAFNPTLWRSIAISESRHSSDFLQSLYRNLPLVRSLRWNYTEWWELHHVSRERVAAPEPRSALVLVPAPMSASSEINKHSPSVGGGGGVLGLSSNHSHLLLASTSSSSLSATMPRSGGIAIQPPCRPVYRAPSPISFPTSASLHYLCFENACSLRSLVLDGPFELIPLLETLKGSSPLLNHLSLKNTNCMRREIVPLKLLLRVSPTLEMFSIRTNAQVLTLASPLPSSSSTQCVGEDEEDEGPLVLKSLELDIRALTGVQLMLILVQCPDLEAFTTTEYGQVSPLRDFKAQSQVPVVTTDANAQSALVSTKNLDSEGPSLQSETSCTEDLVNLFPTFLHRGLESVRFSDVALTTLQHFNGCSSSSNLTSLDLSQASSGKIQSKTLQKFLQSCTGLIHLRVRGMVIQVEDMVDPWTRALLPWACTGLETLSIAFGVAPWPLRNDDPTIASGSGFRGIAPSPPAPFLPSLAVNNDDIIQSRACHAAWAERTVYRQLSMLTALRILDIRQSFLRLQVGTGIEMLASLQKLKEFSIAGSEMEGGRVDEAMDSWFGQHWPSVDRIVVASRACTLKAAALSSPVTFIERRRSC